MHSEGAVTMARYNAWMNEKLLGQAEALGTDRIDVDQGAFFRSIVGTFQHIMVGDLVWLRRYAAAPELMRLVDPLQSFPEVPALDARLFPDWPSFVAARQRLDHVLLTFVQSLTSEEMNLRLSFRSLKGEPFEAPLWVLLQHLFNHQTHHRGQITTLMMQQGRDPGVTDLMALVREQALQRG